MSEIHDYEKQLGEYCKAVGSIVNDIIDLYCTRRYDDNDYNDPNIIDSNCREVEDSNG